MPGAVAMQRHRASGTEPQGDWSFEEGSCHVVVRLEAVFSKKTMWKKRISQSVQSSGGRAMTELMHLVLSHAKTD